MTTWALGILAFSGLALAGGAFLQTRRVRHERVDLHFDNLPAAFDGYTVLHLSDLHLGPVNRAKAIRLLAFNTPPADLCVVTGDLIETDAAIAPCVEALGRLRSRDGVVCVLGNHDHYRYTLWDALTKRDTTDHPNRTELLIRGLARNGVRVLRNESVEIRRNGQSIWLAGVDDPVTHKQDLSAARRSIPPGAFRILLSHTPDVLRDPSCSDESLVLSGHTHGGQVVLPLLGPILNHSKLMPGFVSGTIRQGKTLLVVSNGLGVNRFFPFRFRCRPEVHTLRLCLQGPVAGFPQGSGGRSMWRTG